MKVVCNKNTGSLVKGAIYNVQSLKNKIDRTNSSFRSVIIVDANNNFIRTTWGINSPKPFSNLDGSAISEIDWESDDYKYHLHKRDNLKIVDVRKLKKGDFIYCNFETKHFIRGKIYKISDLLYEETQGKYRPIVTQKVKIDGYNQWLSTYKFRLCTAQEIREISLNNVFEETNDNIASVSETKNQRYLERYTDKQQKILILSTIFDSIRDTNRNNLSVVDWAVNKKGKLKGIKIDDIKPFLNLKLSEIVKMLD